MWDNGRTLKLLKELRYDAVTLQHIIDVDKYIASEKEGCDLCGKYMPYCAFCNKWVKNPCASAYFAGEHFLTVCPLIERCGATEAAVIQAITDVDKYLASQHVDFDVCGRYAPFCVMCDKSVENPCAMAYLRYKEVMGGVPVIEEASPVEEAAVTEVVEEPEPEEEPAEEVAEEVVETVEEQPEEPAEPEEPKRRFGIKIATARRRVGEEIIIENKKI